MCITVEKEEYIAKPAPEISTSFKPTFYNMHQM
jgi:hypothetical protein